MAELGLHPFAAPWWLRGAHAQTVWSPAFRRQPPLDTRRERWSTPDDDRLSLHFVDGDPDRPRVLLLHGLEGSVRSNYVIGSARRFRRHGWNVVALEFRSCDGEMNRARRMYHSGETSDLDFVVRELHRREPETPLYVASVSLGGNVLAKWLGEHGDEVPGNVVAAAAVSLPFDLPRSAVATDRALGGFYARRFLETLVPKALAKERQYPGTFDVEVIRRARNLATFDDHATAPLHGFRDAQDYWQKASCGPYLERVRRPLLLVAAQDDPFNPGATHPRELLERSPWLLPQLPERGGHVGFVHGWPWRTRHWAEEQVERFFLAVDAFYTGVPRRA